MSATKRVDASPLSLTISEAQLYPFLRNPRRHGLADGPVEGFHQPGVAREAHLAGALVDPFGEFVGKSKVHMFRHGRDDSTCTSNIATAIICPMHTTVAQNIAHRTDAVWIKTAKSVRVNGENYTSEYRNVFTGQSIRKDWRMTGQDWVIFDSADQVVGRAHSLTWAKMDAAA